MPRCRNFHRPASLWCRHHQFPWRASRGGIPAWALAIAPWCSAMWRSTRDHFSCIAGRRDVPVGATSRRDVQTGAQCRFWKRCRRGTKATSHSEHDERIRFSPKSSEYTPPATAIQRSKHCKTRVLGQKQAKTGAHEPLPIRGSQPLYQVRR